MWRAEILRRVPVVPVCVRWITEAVAAGAFVVLVYEAVVAGALALWPDASDSWILLLWITAATISGLGLNHVRRLVGAALRRVWPATAGRSHALTALTAAAQAADTDERIFADVAALVAAGTGARTVQVWIAEPTNGLRCAGEWPATTGDPEPATSRSAPDLDAVGQMSVVDTVAPVRDGTELVGALAFGVDPRRVPAGHDLRLAADVADAVALLLRNITLTSAVQEALRREQAQAASLTRSRHRLVVARDVARTRLSSQIQDRVGRTLARCADDVDRLLDMRPDGTNGTDDEPAAAEIRRAMNERLDVAIADFRDIVHGFYPATLTDHGLGPCLDNLVAELPWPVAFRGAELPRLDDRVELGVYFCVGAVIDALREAPAQAARPPIRRIELDVRLDRLATPNALAVVLHVHTDVTTGDGEQAATPLGLTDDTTDAIQDRVDALDGDWALRAEPDGVLIQVMIPVPPEPNPATDTDGERS